MKALLFALTILASSFALAAPERIGLFIGSVDPITEGHTDVIRAGVEQLGLERIVIMVNTSSDKDYSASIGERTALARLALNALRLPNVKFEIIGEPPEGKREFAIRTARERGGGSIFQIAGEDVQPKAQELFKGVGEVKSYILPRLDRGEQEREARLLDGFHLLKPIRVTSISSTEVKENLERGLPLGDTVSPLEQLEIAKRGLYFPLTDAEAEVKARWMEEKMRYLREALKTSADWSQLNIPELSFQLKDGVSTTNNLTFNRIQSIEASEELLVRSILKKNSSLSKAQQYQLRLWAAEYFQGSSNLSLDRRYEAVMEQTAQKAIVVVMSHEGELAELLGKLRAQKSALAGSVRVLVLKGPQISSQAVDSLREAVGAAAQVETLPMKRAELMLQMDQRMRAWRTRPIIVASEKTLAQEVSNLADYRRARETRARSCRSMF